MTPQPTLDLANHRILIIDDNPAIHADFRKVLGPVDRPSVDDLDEDEAALFGDAPEASRQWAFEIDSAMQGQEGLQMVQRALEEGRPYSTAFVDVRMPPGWDGVETIHHLWKCDPDLQVVICTAYSDFSWEQITARLGATDKLLILKKPFDNVEVLQFAHALTEKWMLGRRANMRMEQLDQLVLDRTSALQAANEALSLEMKERVLIEAALRVSELRFSKAFNASPIAMAIVAKQGLRFADANAAFSRLIGWSHEEVLLETVPTLPMWANPADLVDVCEQLEGEPCMHGQACVIKTSSSVNRDVRLTAEAFDLGGAAHYLLLMEDVTERLQLEARLLQSQKMEAIGQLAAGVAHDFNNILTVIRGHVGLQLANAQIQGSQRSSLAQVLAASERASALTRQLLSFSRRQVAKPRAMQMERVIASVTDMLRRLVGENVSLQVAGMDALPAVVGDAGNVELILMNLVVNARDAMPGGGVVSISATPVDLSAADCRSFPERRSGRFVRLTVSDTGCGMKPEVLAHIFEPFFTTKDVGKGTGLGLATVYGIARQHQGWIEVRSQVGIGTDIHVYLPCSDQPVQEVIPDPAVVEVPPRGTETILAAEDEPALRELVQAVLEDAGYKVLVAEDGRSALNLFEQNADEVDLLLTDMMMPGGISGWDLAEKLHERRPNLRVVFMSGYSADLMGNSAPAGGAIQFLQKPYDPKSLLSLVRESFHEELCA
jgi:PAS domain S-box-containing protein